MALLKGVMPQTTNFILYVDRNSSFYLLKILVHKILILPLGQ